MQPGANNERVYRMHFASVDPPFMIMVEMKGRTTEGALSTLLIGHCGKV